MPDVREYHSLMEAAEQAAGAGEFARADTLLREALGLQEAALGPAHPDLASTLNNLAVVCETTGHVQDAERFYRRAHAVAAAALDPADPLVTTSRENLRDFCAAQGLPVDAAPAIPDVAAPPTPARSTSTPAVIGGSTDLGHAATAAAPRVAKATPPPAPAPARATEGWPKAKLAAAVVAVMAVAGAATAVRFWTPMAVPDRPAATSPAPLQTAPSPSAPPVAPAAAPAAPQSAIGAPEQPPAVTPAGTPPGAAPAAGVRVVTAEVCRTLTTEGTWRCGPLGAPAEPGRAVFYTRIASPSAMQVQHVWYLGPAVRQRVSLAIAANPGEGYRTFSGHTLTPGAWRVELRAADGSLLHETSIDVR